MLGALALRVRERIVECRIVKGRHMSADLQIHGIQHVRTENLCKAYGSRGSRKYTPFYYTEACIRAAIAKFDKCYISFHRSFLGEFALRLL